MLSGGATEHAPMRDDLTSMHYDRMRLTALVARHVL